MDNGPFMYRPYGVFRKHFPSLLPLTFQRYLMSYQIFTRYQLYCYTRRFSHTKFRNPVARQVHISSTADGSRKAGAQAYTPISLYASKISGRNRTRISKNAGFWFLGIEFAFLDNSWDATACREHSRSNIENSRIFREWTGTAFNTAVLLLMLLKSLAKSNKGNRLIERIILSNICISAYMPRVIKIHLKINGSIDPQLRNGPLLLRCLVIGFKAPKPFRKQRRF